ncbi:MAG TPA: alpha/beta hydrolase [Porticoccaceae bacterium]|nr:alpha/beta hydrolase [Gammaproteobacteria bacterium]HIL61276.1 alpha/beta hydrolase [Porticoccaceae bacterium]
MKLPNWRQQPTTKFRLAMGMLIILSSFTNTTNLFAEETSSEAAGEAYEENWWRSVRQGMWQWEGADWTRVSEALSRIENATGKRRYEDKVDTITKYGTGHWVYEWSRIGKQAQKEAKKYEKKGDSQAALNAYIEASIYYTQASYPHFRDKHSRNAITKAVEMYKQAGRHFATPFESWELEVDGAKFTALVHFPAKQSSTPYPVIMKTGGMDVFSTEYYPLSKTINDAGAVMVVFDAPGTGNLGIVDANYDKHHVAVLQHIMKDKRFDAERIGVWSESLAGLTAVRIALGEHRKNIAAAVNSCGPMHSLYAMELTGPSPDGYDVHALVNAYNKGTLSDAEMASFNKAKLTPALAGMFMDFQSQTFFDRARANPDNVLDIMAKSLPVSLIEQGLIGKSNMTNTPILTINTHADPLVPLSESQMATDVSVQGKLMIINEYGGHCVSRDEVPVIMEWLAFHLKLETLGDLVKINRGG